MNYKRRSILKAFTAAFMASGPAIGQADLLPPCTEKLSLADGVGAQSTFSTGPADSDTTETVRAEYGTLRLDLTYRPERTDGADPGSRRFSLALTQPEGGGKTRIAFWTSALICPTTSCGSEEEMQLRLMVDGQAFARVRLTAGEARASNSRSWPVLDDDQERELRQGRTLWIEVATRAVSERGEVSIRGIDGWLKEAEAFHRTRIRTALENGATCESGSAIPVAPCYMTTLIGHRLGRGASAFEQRQMNKLQPRFAAYGEHIETYVHDAMRIGDRREEPHMRAALLAFYAIFIWPAALLISIRAIWPRALWYFAGFQALKGLHALTRPSGPAPSGG